MKDFQNFWRLLNNYQKSVFLFLVLASIISTFIEMVGIFAVIPFVTFLLKPEELNNFEYLSNYIDLSNLTLETEIIIIFCIIFFLIFLVKNIVVIIISKLTYKFIFSFQTKLYLKVAKKLLHQDYLFFVDKGVGQINNVLSLEIRNYCAKVVASMILLVRELMIILGILILILLSGYIEKLLLILPLIILIALLLKSINKSIKEWSVKRIKNNENLTKSNYSLITGIKEILIVGRIKGFLNFIFQNLKSLEEIDIKNNTIANYPKVILEQSVIAIFVIIIIVMSMQISDFDETIIILSFYLAVSYRITPSFNTIALSYQKIKFGKPSYDKIKQFLDLHDKNVFLEKEAKINSIFEFKKKIELRNISFNFLNRKNIIENLSFEINKNQIIGIFGESGSGKTTFLNIITQIIKQDSGSLFLDGTEISDQKEIRRYQNLFFMVSQDTFLLNGSIKDNIIYGTDNDNISNNKIQEALSFALLNETIKNFSDGINTQIGLAIKKLSSGQKQRIALARAFYNDREILVIDEATNSLDEKNEKEIFENILKLKEKKTIIIISHKRSNLKICDNIFEFKNNNLFEIKN